MAIAKDEELTPIGTRLSVNQKVEVKSLEDGFSGSWRSATILSLNAETCRVQYDRICSPRLSGNEKIYETVSLLDTPRRARPRPPRVRVDASGWRLGLCVDVYYKGAWCAGVVIDRNNGFNERDVFVLGDGGGGYVVRARVGNLRISHEYDAFFGAWKVRGTWQLCDDDFLAQVIRNSINPVRTNNHKMVNVVNSDSKLDCYQVSLPEESRVDGCDDGNSNVGSVNSLGELSRKTDPRKIKSNKTVDRRCSLKWFLVTEDMLQSDRDPSPAAIEEFTSFRTKRPPEQLINCVRKQLLHLGWKIERVIDQRTGAYRYKYTSPDTSQFYMSLRELCRDLKDPGCENRSSPVIVTDDDQTNNPTNIVSEGEQGRKRKRSLKPELEPEIEPNLSHENDRTHSEGKKKIRITQSGIMVDEAIRALQSGKGLKNEIATENVHKKAKKEETLPLRNPRTILSWLLDNDMVQPNANVYYKGGKKRTEGTITHDGILCDCCNTTVSLTTFEAHAGSTKHRPAANIILEDGRSLVDCQRQISRDNKAARVTRKNRKDQIKDSSDVVCSVCYQSGDLLLCDGCPATFHKDCLGMEQVPRGKWFCPPCRCHICEQHELNEGESDLLNCDQCRRQFHIACQQHTGVPERTSDRFCSRTCEAVFSGLQSLLEKPFNAGNLSWKLLKPSGSDDDCENQKNLNSALDVMHECFEPLNDDYSGKDVVEDVVFGRGSNLRRLNCKGFYTILVEKDGEVAAAANVRVLGNKVAEIPLVGTRFQFRKLGICRMLIGVLERILKKLGVERMVLPAAKAALDVWTNAFGFSEMSESERRKFLDFTILSFPGTVMCQKMLKQSGIS